MPFTRHHPTPRLLLALLLAGCAAGPKFSDHLDAAATHLDCGRNAEAIGFLHEALDATTVAGERELAMAMLVEAHLAAGDDAHASEALDVLRSAAPRAFVTWKAQAVHELHRRGTAAARTALLAARGIRGNESQGAWLRDFEALLDGVDAFADGDFVAARSRLDGIRHADVTPAAAWLLGRLDAIGRVRESRISMARRAGARAGLIDLWHAATGQSEVQQQIAEYGRQIGVPLGPPTSPNPAGVALARDRLPVTNLGLACSAAWAAMATETTPMRLRSN